MTITEFRKSLAEDAPPHLPSLVKAHWHDARGDWDRAHQIAQEVSSREGSWVHAYLHRKEGDLGNANYWYSRAGRAEPSTSLDAEWEEIAAYLLGKE
jgi:hypothetical protein